MNGADIGFGFHAKLRSLYFDRDFVKKHVDPVVAKKLSMAGRFIQVDAQRSQRPAKPGRASPSGSPPFAHLEHARRAENTKRKKQGLAKIEASSVFKGLRQISFYFDPARKSVIVGPESRTGGKITRLHEFGGSMVAKYGRQVEQSQRKPNGRFGLNRIGYIKRGTVMTYPARPYMRPAFNRTVLKLSTLFKDSIRPGAGGAIASAQAAAG